MSGFVGIANLDGAPVDRELLERMARALAFRGPDGVSVRCDGPIGLGHALLRTDDVGRAEAGLASSGGGLQIVADARLDGREDALAALSPESRSRLRKASDAALILQLYAERGEPGLDALIGDFAFAIWDGPRCRLVARRDHFGVKPFFYSRVGGALVFGNTLRCLLLHPRVQRVADEEVIADFLVTGENPQLGATFFRDVRRLAPAHGLVARGDSVSVSRYWELPVADDVRYRRGEEYIERFTELFRRAVADRLPARRVSLAMSGGLDSTSVAALAREVMDGRGAPDALCAFTGVYERLLPDDEGHYAGLVARHLAIPILTSAADDCELFATLGRASATAPQPVIDPLEAGDDLYRAAAAHSRVLLTGHGGDPAFRSSPFYLVGLLRRGRVRRLARETLRHLLDFRRPPATGARTFWRRTLRPPDPFAAYPSWLEPGFEARWNLRERWRESQRPLGRVESAHPTRPEAHAALQASAWPNHFEYLDPGTAVAHLEVRHPFFDVRLLRFVLGIPAIPWCVHKELMRRCMRGRLPEAVRIRPKSPLRGHAVHPFPHPRFVALAEFLRGASGLERFVRVEALVERLSARESIGPLELHQTFSAVALAEWLHGPWRPAAARTQPAPRRDAPKESSLVYAQA